MPAQDSRADRLARWENWLSRDTEAPLDPHQVIVDPHHHLWDRGGHRYLADEFRRDIAENRVVATVYVECLSSYRPAGAQHLRPAGETDFISALSGTALAPYNICRGIVGYADLSLAARVNDVLDAHLEHAGHRFKGVRFATAWDSDPTVHGSYITRQSMLLEPNVVTGACVLAQRGLSLDLWLYYHQLNEAAVLARACPTLSIVIDHCGGPIGIDGYSIPSAAVFDAWRKQLDAFRALPNVALKFGGLAMPLAGFGWNSRDMPPRSEELARAWRPYFDECLDVFGPQRCLFESNFPVDRTGCTYTGLWNAYKRLAERLKASERSALFEGNSRRIYRL